MDKDIINWMLEGPGWLQYAVKLQLLNLKPDVNLALQDPSIMKIIDRLKDKHVGIPAIRTGDVKYSKTGNAYWDLFFLADIGLAISDLKLNEQIEEFFSLQSPDGSFITEKDMKPNYFCISAILLSSIAKMDYRNDLRLKKYIEMILDSQRLDGGWHCAKSRAVGNRLQNTESCPMDNLNILMLVGQYEEYRTDSRFNGAIDLLLEHWEKRVDNWRPYGFGIGTEFTRLRYPAVKYGILRVMDVLSLFPYAIKSETFKDMLSFVHQRSSDGKYYAESVARSYAEFDFGQKKEPSKWITFLVNRIDKKYDEYK
ncbi:hypothetical protein V7O66_04195 [Methanolobus sp. ZRKC3]|uniref:hypothetical protein n=1 Tax=Methanolobus sp. ZRKC3 TaxID=3125786 RepID=UPI003246D025